MRGLVRFWLALGGLLASATSFGQGTDGPFSYLPSLTSYVQLRYTDPSEGDDTWAIRRLKAMLDGGLDDGIRYHVQLIYKTNLGSSTDDQVFLQDAYLTLPATASLAFKIGQFVPPFGLERFQPDWSLDFVDRTDVTNQMVVNGNLGKSFARDRGLQADWKRGGWQVAAGLFQGEGANMSLHGDGPLGAARASYGHGRSPGGESWSWRVGLAVSDRHDADLDLSGEFPGLAKALTSHFEGRDSRLNAFTAADFGRVRGQAEYFRTWLSPRQGAEIAARGAYGQVAYLPFPQLILAVRYEWFTPDLNDPQVPSLKQWTPAITYDLRGVPLRLAADCTFPTGGMKAHTHTWRVQVQYVLLKGFRLGR